MDKNCKICKNKTKKVQDEKIGTFLFCARCGFISKPQESFLSPKEEIERYNQHNNSIEDPRYVLFFEKFIKAAFLNFVKKSTKGLDFGSGPSPVLAQILEKHYGFHMDIYDVYYSPEKIYEGKTYDFITSTEVVEHLSKPMDAFHLFNKLLKPGGIAAIMTLLHHNDEQRFLQWHYHKDLTHISFFSSKTMEYIARKTGFKIIYNDDKRYITFQKK